MRVLLASQYFPPEITAASGRLLSFATGLARRGHQVEVICEVPNHPSGIVHPGYGGRLVDRRRMHGFDVSYVWVHATQSKRTRARLANYGSYMLSATVGGLRGHRPDVILASSPPLPVGVVGAALAARYRVPWVLDVRDLWPDVAVVVEQVGEGQMVRAARRLERRLYRSAAAITTTTEAFVREIGAREGRGKVELLRNGASDEFLRAGLEEPDGSLLRNRDDRFIWTYAGNIGLAQGLESAVEAAARLGDDFRLVLLGDGPRREDLRGLASGVGAGSVTFMDPVPAPEAARILRASDALLVSLGAAPGLEGFVPSKLFDCCAIGRPVVVAAAGEASEIVTEAGAAVTVPPGDPDRLADAVRGLRDDAGKAERTAGLGRKFAERHSRDRGVERLESILGRVLGSRTD